jgi:polysaccharide biosynthesis/export protein
VLKYKHILYILTLLISLSSCGINSDIMFRSPKGDNSNKQSKYYEIVSPDSLPREREEDYRLTIDDRITLTVSPNDGKQIIESVTSTSQSTTSGGNVFRGIEYTIRTDGFINLPLIGDVRLNGLTIKQTEDTLKARFSEFYIDPFIIVKVVNKRVIVFPGGGGDAKVVYLSNNNTRLMQVLAEAGGISQRGKAKSIKLMRYVNNKRMIVPIDLSTLDGLAYADIIVQGNDYIYVEPNPRVMREALQQATPFFSFVTSLLLFINYFK